MNKLKRKLFLGYATEIENLLLILRSIRKKVELNSCLLIIIQSMGFTVLVACPTTIYIFHQLLSLPKRKATHYTAIAKRL